MNRVPFALPGRDSIQLNIFGMQGVPKQMIEQRIMAGSTSYWNKVKNA